MAGRVEGSCLNCFRVVMSESDSDVEWDEDLHDDPAAEIQGPTARPSPANATDRSDAAISISDAGDNIFSEVDFLRIQKAYLERVKTQGISEMKWSNVLTTWQRELKDFDFENVEELAVRKIMHASRLSSSAQPMFYESLRRLGQDLMSDAILSEAEAGLEEIMMRLNPDEGGEIPFSEWYLDWSPKAWIENIRANVKNMLGNNVKMDLSQERTLGFIVSHVRTHRYHEVELAAIVRHLTRHVAQEERTHLDALASELEAEKSEEARGGADSAPAFSGSTHPRTAEAQSFIIRCVEIIQRHRQSYSAAEMRGSQMGVILFCEPFRASTDAGPQKSELDRWFEARKQQRSQPSRKPDTLKVLRDIIRKEQEAWAEWKEKLEQRRSVKVATPRLFNVKWGDAKVFQTVISRMETYAAEKVQLIKAAENAKEAHCVPQVIADFPSQEPDYQASTERVGRKKRKVAIFGYTMKDNATISPEAMTEPSEISVIVRKVKLEWSNETQSSEVSFIYEIGVGLDGSYVDFPYDDKEGLFNGPGLGLTDDELTFFRFIPQDKHATRSRSIEELFSSSDDNPYTHVILQLPSSDSKSADPVYNDIADTGGRFLIDMDRSGFVVSEGMKYYALPVKPEASAATLSCGARGFRRLAVLVPPSVPQDILNVVHKGKKRSQDAGFSESAEIIAEVLSLAVIDNSSVLDSGRKEQMRQRLERNPLLLYYTTIELLDAFSDHFARIIEEYWQDKLKMSRNAFVHLSMEEIESRTIVLALITGRQAPGGDTNFIGASATDRQAVRGKDVGARSSTAGRRLGTTAKSGGPPMRIALASEPHLKFLPQIIMRETHFSQETIYIEETNFESTLLRLKNISSASLTFVFVYITGKLSADQINRIVNVPSATMKLIFRTSQSITSLLELTNVRDMVFLPPSINTDFQVERRSVQYSKTSAVGSVLNFTEEEISHDPFSLHAPGPYWEEGTVDREVQGRLRWVEEVKEWAERPYDEAEGLASFVRVLITSDHSMTCSELEKALGSTVAVDAGDRKKFDELKVFLDRRTASPAPNLRSRQGRGDPNSSINGTGRHSASQSQDVEGSEVFILSRASFLPHARLEVLVSRCCTREAKLLMLVNEPTSAMSRFRVYTHTRAPPMWIRVATIMQRFTPLRVCDGTAPSLSGRDLSPDDLVFQGLQLLWSHENLVTEDHRKAVKSLMESLRDGVLGETNPLGFLENMEEIDLEAVALAMASTESSDNVPEQNVSLAVILAMHINRYLRFPSENAVTSRVSFLDFCKQPLARFLSQIHRVEAYICFLFTRTDPSKRLCSESRPETPFGCPLTHNFIGLSNVHSTSSPGALLKAIYDRAAASKHRSAPAPQYLDPERGDAMVHRQEITEHRALMGAELHWEEVFVTWQSGPDLKEESLDHILVYSPSRISVLLSMSQQTIVNLTLSARALEAVATDFETCVGLLRRLPIRVAKDLRTRAASIFWLILKSGGKLSADVSVEFFEHDQPILLEAGVFLEPGSASEGTELLFCVAKAIIQLDVENALTTQHTVREFLFSDDNSDAVLEILHDDAVKIGRAFMVECLSDDGLKSITEGSCGKAIFEALRPILRWVKDPGSAEETELQAAVRPFKSRFTAPALSYIIQSANLSKDASERDAELELARDGMLRDCVAARLEPGLFLGQVLQPLCTEDNRSLAMDVMYVLAQTAVEDLPTPHLDDTTGPWMAIYCAFKEMVLASNEDNSPCEAAGRLFDAAQKQDFKLPFEASDVLCKMYIAFCKNAFAAREDKVKGVQDQLKQHGRLLQTDRARTAVCKLAAADCDDNHGLLLLVWFTWWSCPWETLPQRSMPWPQTWRLFRDVVGAVRPKQSALSKGMSTLARFALAPQTLPVSILNMLKQKIVGSANGDSEPHVESKHYILGQRNQEPWPLYSFRAHSRPLPTEDRKRLMQETMAELSKSGGAGLTAFPATSSSVLHLQAWFPITNCGVSVEMVKHNLKILLNIKSFSPKNGSQPLTEEQAQAPRAQIFLAVVSWFRAAGFDQEHLVEMVGDQFRPKLRANWAEMKKMWEGPSFVDNVVLCCLPVYAEVRLLSSTGKDKVALFHSDADSAETTRQWVSMLLTQYGDLSQDKSDAIYDFMCKAIEGVDWDSLRFAQTLQERVKEVMQDIGAVLVRRHHTLNLAQRRQTAHVVEELLPLSDFFAQLRASKTRPEFAKSAINGLAEALSQGSRELQVCVADGLYILVGVTPENEGVEVLHMMHQWYRKKLAMGSSVIKEMIWMATNIYTGPLPELAKKLQEAAGLGHDKVEYVRKADDSSPVLSDFLQSTIRDPVALYDFNEYKLQKDPEASLVSRICPPTASAGGAAVEGTETKIAENPGAAPKHQANFDHVRESPNERTNANLSDPALEVTLFKQPHSEDMVSLAQRKSRTSGDGAKQPLRTARTISAKGLLTFETHPRFGILRIRPGLHPVLRAPGDEQCIPFMKQESLDRSHASSELASGKISAIFSHNGYTWDHLNKLPSGSTLMCSGFYLRKSEQGAWVLLVATTNDQSLEKPPYMLWTMMDNLRLAALDLDKEVEQLLRLMVGVAYDAETACGCLQDSIFSDVLEAIRRQSADAENLGEYRKYLEREWTVCNHFRQEVLVAIEREAKKGHLLNYSFLKMAKLEADLAKLANVPSFSRGLQTAISKSLCGIVGKTDPVPRSQLIYALEEAIENNIAFRRSMGEDEDGFEDIDSSERQGHEQESDEDEDEEAEEGGMDIFSENFGTNASEHEQVHRKSLESQGYLTRNRLIAKHEHITQEKFREKSMHYINALNEEADLKVDSVWIEPFIDSDDEVENAPDGGPRSSSPENETANRVVEDHLHEHMQSASETTIYEDNHLDQGGQTDDVRRDTLFPATWGYGKPLYSHSCVVSVLGDNVPLYFIQIDCRRMKIQYSDAEGLPIAFVFHKKLLDKALKDFKEAATLEATTSSLSESDKPEPRLAADSIDVKLLAYREKLLRWVTDLVRSPLPLDAKHWFTDKLQNGLTSTVVPFLGDAFETEEEKTMGGDLNLLVIAYCLATALPEDIGTKDIVRNALNIPKAFLPFCRRKDHLYGIHIVRGGTLSEMKDFGAIVEVCDLGYDALTRAKDNSSMYLSIIGKFAKFTWVVYVQGLDMIDDALLKWLAEYTKAHPWRFVYLENTQTSWNFSENRDRTTHGLRRSSNFHVSHSDFALILCPCLNLRGLTCLLSGCVYDRAPVPVERTIRTTEDLNLPAVKQLRPHHIQPYDRLKYRTSDGDIRKMKWDTITRFTWSFFGNCSTDLDESVSLEIAAEKWSAFGAHGSETIDAGQDYRDTVRGIFGSPDPCVVLLCSPPGAGKSHFSNELAERVQRRHGYRRAFIDGSDDRLVDMALREILDLELPDSSKFLFLIVDEFHMLNEYHKRDLFEWLQDRSKRLQVLLIANRKDSRDEELMCTLRTQASGIPQNAQRVRTITTRLSATLLKEVMQQYNTKYMKEIQCWMHCARALFGGEAVSLRNIKDLDDIVGTIKDRTGEQQGLVDLLLNKVPILSSATADHFVSAFLASLKSPTDPVGEVQRAVKGPVSLMFQAALCTLENDGVGMDFPDFVSFGLNRAYDAPPSLRIAAWCCHMRSVAKKGSGRNMDFPESIFHPILVDQCGFPLQLEDAGASNNLAEGHAFSWGGDYTRMREIIDAVKHGHSVDWTDVRDRCWKFEPVQDSSLLVELLSVCASPGKVLDALTKDNLCNLLKKSNPADSLKIAQEILRNQTYRKSAEADSFLSPYRTAVWMSIVHDPELKQPAQMIEQMSGPSPNKLDDVVVELVHILRWASTCMQDMVICEHPEQRTMVLIELLVYLSRHLLSSGRSKLVPSLWHGMFAPLVIILLHGIGPTKDKSNDDIIVNVVIHAQNLAHTWPQPVPVLWAIAHGKGTASQVADLWGDASEVAKVHEYRRLLFCRDRREGGIADPSQPPIHPVLAAGILSVSGHIDYELQEALLTRGGDVDMHAGVSLRDPTRLLRSAIENLVKEGKESSIQLADGDFKSCVMDVVQDCKRNQTD